MILGFAGLAIAGYLTMAHWMGAELACIIGSGCGKIANSKYAWIPFGSQGTPTFGIPVAFFGFLSYAILTALAILRSIKGDPKGSLTQVGTVLTGIGFLASAALMYIAFGVVQATCIWCIASAIIMTAMFLLHLTMKGEDVLEAHPNTALLASLAVVCFGVLGWQAVALSPKIETIAMTPEDLTPKDPKIMGVRGAKLVIVEFADLTCPHCKDSYDEFKRLLSSEGAQFEIIFRSYPLRGMAGHEMGLPAAAIGEVVSETGKFFQYVDMCFGADPATLTVPKLLGFAKSLGLDPAVVSKRVADEKDPAFIRLKEDIAAGDKLGILQTPTFYIGERGKNVYPAKMNSRAQVMFLPEIHKLWDAKLIKK